MSTFFSGEDMKELHDNTANYPFYLSLIVNFNGDYKAKIAFIATEKDSYLETNPGMNNIKIPLQRAAENIVTFDCTIVKERFDWSPVPALLANWTALKEKKARTTTTYPDYSTSGIAGYRKDVGVSSYNPRESFQKNQEKANETLKKFDKEATKKVQEINWKEDRSMLLPPIIPIQIDRVLCKILYRDPNCKDDFSRKALLTVNAALTDAKSRDEFYTSSIDILQDCIEEEFVWGSVEFDLNTMCQVGTALIEELYKPGMYSIPLAKDLIDIIASQCNEMLDDYEQEVLKEISKNKSDRNQIEMFGSFKDFVND